MNFETKQPHECKVVDNYILNTKEILGKGSFGSVYLAINKKNG